MVACGTVLASFLVTACLNKLTDDEYSNFQVACTSIKYFFYMDDYLGGINTKAKSVKFHDDLWNVLQFTGFYL